jgi:diguanylate cyclase (GGDEF)-like protein
MIKLSYEAMWQQITGTGLWEGEIWDKRKNGDIYPKWLTITTVHDAANQVSHYVGVFSDISQRKLAEEEIYSLAYYDTLTKFPNRRLLHDRFGLALAVSERSGNYGAVLFLDLDKFKTLNDTLGHGYGDLLLIEVAGRIKACVRAMDTIARMGGDEFVVLIEEVSSDAEEATQKAAHIAEKIRSALAQPYFLAGHEQHSSPSIGVCLYRGRAESVESLLKHADLAMYQAKESGRNTVCFFDPVMQQAVEGRAALEADLRHAVSLQQLRLYYQIQLDNEHRPLGAEALLRWIHPIRGMVSPAQFIPLAEETMLILEIGHWVLESACQQLKLWEQHARTRDLTIAVNVSAQQFAMPDFVGQVAASLHKHRVDPARLKLELTESVVLDDVQGTVAIMHALKGLGVRLSMDDFGTGYSSLSYLKILPLDQLKIDQSFVRDITSDPNDAVLVQTIIDMARNFRLNVIAEGVETEAQLAFLKQHGCMAYQGYLFSKPVPLEEFEALLGGL